ncbi:c-type cytochrome [Vibrio harveyi]|uniref:c-type cytochrome n=1 Tax=Vibrio harveyi TaxID=669 RepID=UPI0027EBB360|nr:cytochrome c [Vibrio harveyi]EKY4194324.1 cytochrome c [Vibrio harveyi]
MRKFFFSVVFLLLVSSFGFAGYKWFTDNQYGEADLVAGKQRFESYCVSCHGDKGHGDGLVAKAMNIKPDNISAELLNPFGTKVELIGSVLEGGNGQGGEMPPFKTVLSENEVNDIFEYIKSIN